jgi:hypothetical protein
MEAATSMDRTEGDREDLMREATALARRVELRVPGMDYPIVAGFRDDDRLSLYFGNARYYQFDPHGRLRRALVDEHLFRTSGSTLAELTRQRTSTATQLFRRDLNADQLKVFLGELRDNLSVLERTLESNEAVVIRQVPEAEPIVPTLRQVLANILSQPLALADPINPHR